MQRHKNNYRRDLTMTEHKALVVIHGGEQPYSWSTRMNLEALGLIVMGKTKDKLTRDGEIALDSGRVTVHQS